MGLLCSVVLGSIRSCKTPSLNTLKAGRILAKFWACVYSVCTFQCTYMVHTTILSGSIPHSQLLLCQVKVQGPYCVNMWVCACLTSSVKYTLTLSFLHYGIHHKGHKQTCSENTQVRILLVWPVHVLWTTWLKCQEAGSGTTEDSISGTTHSMARHFFSIMLYIISITESFWLMYHTRLPFHSTTWN